MEDANIRKEKFNNIPTGKSRSNSKDNLIKENSNININKHNNIDQSENINEFKRNEHSNEIGYHFLFLIIKHYLCANEAIIRIIYEDYKNSANDNVS